jgi:hypothetical protein
MITGDHDPIGPLLIYLMPVTTLVSRAIGRLRRA